jgi:hypothetical protein
LNYGGKNLLQLVFSSFDFAFDIPGSFFKILNGIILKIRSPDIFDGISKAKIHLFRYLNTFDRFSTFGTVCCRGSVVGRMVYGIILFIHIFPPLYILERETGLEPATSTLAKSRSTN